MNVFLKLLLVVGLLLAPVPVCKVALAEVWTHTPPTDTAPPPCCAKCKHPTRDHTPPAPVNREAPKKPNCPLDCPAGVPPAAVVSDQGAVTELDRPAAEVLSELPALNVPDGFHALLDRPPRG